MKGWFIMEEKKIEKKEVNYADYVKKEDFNPTLDCRSIKEYEENCKKVTSSNK